ncbi:MAG: M20/M25/M40 family metallo-hydrolase, partial [Actinomycetota bacterium]|nr:M20/M25/M40 family metallo-hydrolase [Actinomycetota bacterium]
AAARAALWAGMARRVVVMWAARGLRFEAQERHRAPAAPCAPWLTDAVVAGIETTGQQEPVGLWSRAGHDAMAMARITDIGMLFLRCHDGISHHPDEAVLLEDVEVGLDAFEAAATLLEHLDDLATYRAAELAQLAGVSKATMSRLFRSLGFADFDEVREHLRTLRTSTGEPRRRDGGSDLPTHLAREAEVVRRAVEHPVVPQVVALLAAARRVTVVGWRNSHPVALHLRQQLAHARGDVRLAPLPGQVVGEELADVGPGDAVVVVGFRRRPAGFGEVLREAAASGADVVLIADPTAIEHARTATLWLECPVSSALAFDSYAAAMSLVSVLADGVLATLGDPAQQRVRAISRAYERMAEVEGG